MTDEEDDVVLDKDGNAVKIPDPTKGELHAWSRTFVLALDTF